MAQVTVAGHGYNFFKEKKNVYFIWINQPLTIIFPATFLTLKPIKMTGWIQLLNVQEIHWNCTCAKLKQCPDFHLEQKITGKATRGWLQGPVLHSYVMSEEGKLWGQERSSRIKQLSAFTSEISSRAHGSRCLLQESGHKDGVRP